jgi:enoyl-CoA hydratase
MTAFDRDLPDSLTIEARGAVRVVRLNRPQQLNAIDRDLHWALANVWRLLAADSEARAVVLTGSGRAFSAGGDLDWIASNLDDEVGRRESLREGAQIIEEMLRFPLPVVAAVNGPAVGLGCSIAIVSDVVLIADDAHLADPHVTVGLAAGDGGAALWPLLTPILRSREFLFTGQAVRADDAVSLGLASRVVPLADLDREAMAVAERMASQPAAAIQATKSIVNMYLSQALAGPMQAGIRAEAATMETAAHRERIEQLRSRR